MPARYCPKYVHAVFLQSLLVMCRAKIQNQKL